MRCPSCDYRLWNIRSRNCPECGTPFLPSEHEFVPNSVQFCCPHCETAYYGTGNNGHLVPIEFDCVSCDAHIHMDQMVLLPTDGLEEEQTTVEQMPWLNRREIGRIRAWFRTIGMALVRPARLMRLTPEQSPTGPAFGFAVLTNTLATFTGMGLFLIPMMIGVFAGGGGAGGSGVLMMAFAFGIICLGTVVMAFLGVLLWGAAAHGLLRLTGPAHAGIGRTYHAIGYSAGANAITAIPVCGAYVGWIWWLISATIMLKEAQKVHGGRAAFAVLTLPLLGIGGAVAMWAFAFYSIITTGSMATSSMVWTNLMPVNGALHDYATRNGNRLPDHAIQLVTEGLISGAEFMVDGSVTRQKRVMIGNLRLDEFAYPPSPEEVRGVDAAIEALPRDIVAHRLGDFVFTYHGIDLNTADPQLWLVVEAPESGSPGRPKFGVGCVRGGPVHIEFQTSDLPAVLEMQNGLRAANGLPPLPDPTTVTHEQPATSED